MNEIRWLAQPSLNCQTMSYCISCTLCWRFLHILRIPSPECHRAAQPISIFPGHSLGWLPQFRLLPKKLWYNALFLDQSFLSRHGFLFVLQATSGSWVDMTPGYAFWLPFHMVTSSTRSEKYLHKPLASFTCGFLGNWSYCSSPSVSLPDIFLLDWWCQGCSSATLSRHSLSSLTMQKSGVQRVPFDRVPFLQFLLMQECCMILIQSTMSSRQSDLYHLVRDLPWQ